MDSRRWTRLVFLAEAGGAAAQAAARAALNRRPRELHLDGDMLELLRAEAERFAMWVKHPHALEAWLPPGARLEWAERARL